MSAASAVGRPEGDGPPPVPAPGPPPVPAIASTPRPADPGPSGTSPTVRAGTRARLDAADRDRATSLAAAEPGSHLRTTIALALGTAALGAAWRFLGPGRE